MTEPTVRIDSNKLCVLWKGGQFCRDMCVYLKQSFIFSKKIQKSAPRSIFDKFSVF